MDRLSSDDNGELLLQPIGYCKELVDGLAAMAVDQGLALERRTDSARVLLGIAQKAASDNIVFVNARTVRALVAPASPRAQSLVHSSTAMSLRLHAYRVY